jgi:histone H3/H4
MVTAAGIDLHTPAVLAAANACVGASRGTITKADVQQAIKTSQ